MSANHKRPLFAFVLLALACSMIIANGVRSQAVVSVVRAGAQHLVAGLVVADASAEPAVARDDSEPEVTPVGPVEVAAQRVFGGGRALAPAGHATIDGPQAKAHRTHPGGHLRHARSAHGRAHGLGHEGTKNLAQKPGGSHVKNHLKSYLKRFLKGHVKSHVKSHRGGSKRHG